MFNTDAYRDNLFQLLGDRDPLEVMAETPSVLDDIVSTYSIEVLRARPFAGKWTPNEIIGHLNDSEWVYGYRQRLMLSEDNPPIIGTRQDDWVARLRHNDRDPRELVATFRTLRALNLASWKRLSPSEMQRTGQHNERGAESLAVMLRILAGHDLGHVNQIRRYIAAVGSTP